MQEENAAVDKVLTNQLLDKVIKALHLKNDAALGRALDLPAPVISKLRHGRLGISPSIILRIHEVTDWQPRDIKAEMQQNCLTLKIMPIESQMAS